MSLSVHDQEGYSTCACLCQCVCVYLYAPQISGIVHFYIQKQLGMGILRKSIVWCYLRILRAELMVTCLPWESPVLFPLARIFHNGGLTQVFRRLTVCQTLSGVQVSAQQQATFLLQQLHFHLSIFCIHLRYMSQEAGLTMRVFAL